MPAAPPAAGAGVKVTEGETTAAAGAADEGEGDDTSEGQELVIDELPPLAGAGVFEELEAALAVDDLWWRR